ncbi:MAG: hypothetical protein ACHQ3P_05260 [Candidatus Limnocylindrales bacterium]
MDALPAILSVTLLVTLAVVSGRAIAGVPDRQANGLSSLLGGWRPQTWPSGIQEDDPEAGWARHPEGRQEAVESGSVVEPADGPMSWIEEFD